MAAITTTHLTNGGQGSSPTSATTASISPTSNRFWTVFVRSRAASGTPNNPTITGCGITWTMQKSIISSSNGMWLFRGVGGPSSGTLVIDFAGQTQSTISWTVDEWQNVDQTGSAGSNGIVQSINGSSGASTSFTMTLAALASANNVAIGFLQQQDQIQTLTLGSGYTALRNNGFDGDGSWLAEYKLNTTTVDASSDGSRTWLGVAAELSFHDNTITTGGAFLMNFI